MKVIMKRMTCILIIMTMISMLMVPAAAKTMFSDIEGNWAEDRITKWADRGLLVAEDGMFKPNENVTRAEFVAVLNRLFGFWEKADIQFSDVSDDSTYANDFLIAKAAGYYKGIGGNKGIPEAPLTREDAVTLLAPLFELKTINTKLDQFIDAEDINSYAAGAVVALVKEGAINGMTLDTFAPKNKLTKAQLIKVIDELVEGYYNEQGTFMDEQYAGNVIVNAAGVVLKNTTIDGNLYITNGIGDGTVTLDNVTVKGKTFINGVEENVVIIDSQLGTIVDSASEKNSQLLDLQIPVTIGGGGELIPAFDPTIMEYTLEVKNDVRMISISAVTDAYLSQVTINESVVESGASNFTFLDQGENEFNIEVTSRDGSVTSYKVTIQREDYTEIINSFLSFTYTDEETGATMPYRLYIPEGYDADKATEYPLVLFLHGSGERGDDNAKQLTANIGATVWATSEVQDIDKAFVLAPQARKAGDGGFGITRDAEGNLNLARAFELSQDAMMAKKVLDDVVSNYKIDNERLYSTGLSQGGIGTWNLNLEYPNLFAAMVPVCGGGNPDHENVSQLVNKPIWAFHAESDFIIPVNFTRDIVDAITKRGGAPKFIAYGADAYFFPVSHFAWIPAYHNDEMREWLFQQKLK